MYLNLDQTISKMIHSKLLIKQTITEATNIEFFGLELDK